MASASESLAAFASELRLSSIPPALRVRVKLHLLDLIGVALASSSMDFGRQASAAARSLAGQGNCTVIGMNERLPAAWAAFVNGTLGHGLDYDDTHQESVVHVSAGIVPAALAASEESRVDGAAFFTALVAGLETSIRIGLAARGALHDRGFHPTGLCNAFGAAVLAAKIERLDAKGIANAIGIAGSQASGLLEFLSDGTDVKRIHGGWAAHAGLVAARLARHDFTGPREALEGRLGFYRSHLGDRGWDLAAATNELGSRWHCGDIALKPYPSCHYNHAFADAALRLRNENRIRAEDVERVECIIAAREIPVVCEPLDAKRSPQTEYGAKFSLPYTIASILVRGTLDLDDFTAAALRDATVSALAQRVDYSIDHETQFPHRFGGKVRLRLKNGRVLEAHEPVNRGSAERPLSRDEVVEKFVRNATRAVAEPQARKIVALIERIEEAPSIDELCASLRARGDRETARAETAKASLASGM